MNELLGYFQPSSNMVKQVGNRLDQEGSHSTERCVRVCQGFPWGISELLQPGLACKRWQS